MRTALDSSMPAVARPFSGSARAGAAILVAGAAYLVPARDAFSRFAWNTSELYINYAGGFVRRGLLGELLRLAASLTGLPPLVLGASAFALLYLAFVVLYVALVHVTVKSPGVFWLLALSPAAIMFPVYDPDAYLRKEVIACILVLLHAFRVLQRSGVERSRLRFEIVLSASLFASTLVHELQIFLLGFHAVLLWFGGTGRAWRRLWPIAPALLLLPVVVWFHGDSLQASSICASWRGIDCSGINAISALGWNSRDYLWYLLKKMLDAPGAVMTYAFALALSLAPVYVAARRPDDATGRSWRAPLGPALVALLPVFALFPLGWDWGRWIHIGTVHVTACFLALAGVEGREAPRFASPGSRATAVLGAILVVGYVAAWRLPHCCPATSLAGGLVDWVMALVHR